MRHKRSFYIRAILYLVYFIFILFVTGMLLGLIINILYNEFSFRLIKIALINSLFLCSGIFLNFMLLRFLHLRIHNFFIVMLSFMLITGVSVAGFVFVTVTEPLFFLYQSNTAYAYILINFLFVISFTLLSTGLMIYQRIILDKQEIIERERDLRKKIEENLFKSKINPHFLFNTINLILSLLSDKKKAEEAILSLSDLLRYNLDMNEQTVISVKREIETAEKYLKLQKSRFLERLNYNLVCDADFFVPPLIIQPLIENCIIHNINHVKTLDIAVQVRKENKANIINIIDSQKKVNTAMIGMGMGLDITKKRVELSGGEFLIRDGGIIIKFHEN